jgi:hypothetical protein
MRRGRNPVLPFSGPEMNDSVFDTGDVEDSPDVLCDNCDRKCEPFMVAMPITLRVDRLCYRKHTFCVECWKTVALDPEQGKLCTWVELAKYELRLSRILQYYLQNGVLSAPGNTDHRVWWCDQRCELSLIA